VDTQPSSKALRRLREVLVATGIYIWP